ncbi:MAG: PaaI family thioesterase [Acidobacteriota bacterium]|nr:PaaI family thioesterase [Acidobacteriota bacterium]
MSEIKITDEHKQLARQILSQNPFVEMLGIELVDLEMGEAVCRLEIEEKHERRGGFVHGGVTASLIDTVTALALATHLQPGENSVTVDLTVHFLQPIYRGAVTARAKVLRAGKRIVTLSAEVYDPKGELAATALTTYSKIMIKR